MIPIITPYQLKNQNQNNECALYCRQSMYRKFPNLRKVHSETTHLHLSQENTLSPLKVSVIDCDRLDQMNQEQKEFNDYQVVRVQNIIKSGSALKMVSLKEKFIKHNLSEQNQVKLRTLYNFGFTIAEKEEKKYIYEVMFGDKVFIIIILLRLKDQVIRYI